MTMIARCLVPRNLSPKIKKRKNCLNQSFGFILPKGRLTVVLLAQSGVTGGFCVTIYPGVLFLAT